MFYGVIRKKFSCKQRACPPKKEHIAAFIYAQVYFFTRQLNSLNLSIISLFSIY